MFLFADRLRRQNHDVLWLAFRLVQVCVCMYVYASVCICVCVRCLCICQPCQDAVNNLMFVPCWTVLTWIFDWFWASHWILFSTVPVFPPSLLYGRHGPAKQTAVHPATWLELHVFYEWQCQPHTPGMLTVMCVLCTGDSEWVCLSFAVALFALRVPSAFSTVLFLLLPFIWTSRTDSGWLFAIHHLQLYSLELYLTYSYKGRSQDFNCSSVQSTGGFFSPRESVSFATADLWLLICGLGYRTTRPHSQARTAGSPVQYEESPMCLLGVSQLSCMWGGRPRAWTVH